MSFQQKKYWFCIWLAGMTMTLCFGQQEPQYTQYMYNIGSFNPAYSASVESAEFSGLYRAQWVDIPGAPRNIRFGGNFPLNNEKMGLGFNAVNDELGPVKQTFIDIAYSYQVNLSETSKLSFGIDAGGALFNIDFSEGNFRDPGESVVTQQELSNFNPTIGAGVFMYDEKWYLGLSVPNFLTDILLNEETASLVTEKMQYNFIGGLVFDIGDKSKFKPAFLVNYSNGLPVNVNLSANFMFIDALTIGASYRFDNAFSGLAGFQVSNGVFLGYAYDYNSNRLGDFSGGTHEAILKFYLGRGDSSNRQSSKNKGKNNNKMKGKPKQIDSPRFF
jgi:type IX secretion system PorP/SprF family membrane protein